VISNILVKPLSGVVRQFFLDGKPRSLPHRDRDHPTGLGQPVEDKFRILASAPVTHQTKKE